MSWVLWGILGGLLCLGGFGFAFCSALFLWRVWDTSRKTLALAGIANQLFHGLFIVVVGALSVRVDRGGVTAAAALVFAGTLLLSGALYGMLPARRMPHLAYAAYAGAFLLCAGWCTFVVTLAMLEAAVA